MIYGNRLIVSQGVFVDFWFSEWQKSLIRRPIDSQLQNYQLKKIFGCGSNFIAPHICLRQWIIGKLLVFWDPKSRVPKRSTCQINHDFPLATSTFPRHFLPAFRSLLKGTGSSFMV